MKPFKVLMTALGMMLILAGCAENKISASGEGAALSAGQTQETGQVQKADSEAGVKSEDKAVPRDAESGKVKDEKALPETDRESDSNRDLEGNILIAYFSRADENYGVGVIQKGNTEIIAEMIAEETGGELFHMERDTPYPAKYKECTDEAKKEQNDHARPALLTDKDISDYDVVFLGYPNWWGDMPMPVYTFLEGHNWNGKMIIPFCTHAGSGLSGTERSIAGTCEGAAVLDGLAVAGTTAQNKQDEARKAVLEWLEGLQY